MTEKQRDNKLNDIETNMHNNMTAKQEDLTDCPRSWCGGLSLPGFACINCYEVDRMRLLQ